MSWILKTDSCRYKTVGYYPFAHPFTLFLFRLDIFTLDKISSFLRILHQVFKCSSVYLTALINAIKAMLFLFAVELNFVLLKGIKIFKETVTSYFGSYIMLL